MTQCIKLSSHCKKRKKVGDLKGPDTRKPSSLRNRRDKSGDSPGGTGNPGKGGARDLQRTGHKLASIQVNTVLSVCSEFAASDK